MKTKYMYSNLVMLSKDIQFKNACKNEDWEMVKEILVDKKILNSVRKNSIDNESEPKIVIAVAHIVTDLVAVVHVGAIAVTMIIGKDNRPKETLNHPILKNLHSLITINSNSKFSCDTFQELKRIEGDSNCVFT